MRWSICNGNPARVLFARCLGVSLIIAGLALATVLTLSRAGRGWRAFAAIPWFLGISTLIAAYKGMCVVLHGLHHQHMRPWELFADPEDASASVPPGPGPGPGSESEAAGGDETAGKGSFDTFGKANSYESEPWLVRYENRNVVRKIFDREMWVQEPALRQIQDVIFIQAVLGALLLVGTLVAVFVPLPAGKLF